MEKVNFIFFQNFIRNVVIEGIYNPANRTVKESNLKLVCQKSTLMSEMCRLLDTKARYWL